MNDNEITWKKSVMFDAIRAYQGGLADIQKHIDEITDKFKGQHLAPEMRVFIAQLTGSIVATTVEVAQVLDT
ncbi:hypothetical protein [Caballeronia sp. LZ035]|uniref:hypothetical protein n=1 Tax=Caballeronia sp. LZ035 TaxID=3038568 RepID=UPI0028627A00|nr:hypothetical protein [Caballeronia sp. LZ035]MDR5763292.1 hypothetical protein [Caballeronia sp. LZ035]